MSETRSRMAAALGVLLALTSCGGGSSPAQPGSAGSVPGTIAGNALTARVVGVGDSLTAGEQSGGLLGKTITPNPLGTQSTFPSVYATQGNGYYALLWSQANGGANPLDPSISPLPLIAPPGIGSQGSVVVPTTAGGLTAIQAPCTGLNLAGLSFSTALSTRLNPTSTPLDVAVPGETLHEALYLYQPTANPCTTYTNTQLQELNVLLGIENLDLEPILANFGQGVTQVQAAVRLRPTIAVVWLGSNDLLKYALSNGAVAMEDPASFQADMTQLIANLQSAGAKVAVANLFNVLTVPQFTAVSALPATLTAKGVPTGEIGAITVAIDSFLQGFGVSSGGYLTLTGTTKTLGVVQAALPSILNGVPASTALQAGFAQLQASSNAFGAGDYVTDAVAAQTAQRVTQYDAAIAAAVSAKGAALVDIASLGAQILQNGGVYALPSNPKCCSIGYGGGLFSLDGLHPSNTFYAIIANAFIQTLDQAYGAGIPIVNVATVNQSDPFSPH